MSNGRIVPLGDPLISGALGLKPYIAINYVDIPSHIRPLSSASHIPTPETVLYNLLKRTSDNYSGLSAQDKNLLLSLNVGGGGVELKWRIHRLHIYFNSWSEIGSKQIDESSYFFFTLLVRRCS